MHDVPSTVAVEFTVAEQLAIGVSMLPVAHSPIVKALAQKLLDAVEGAKDKGQTTNVTVDLTPIDCLALHDALFPHRGAPIMRGIAKKVADAIDAQVLGRQPAAA